MSVSPNMDVDENGVVFQSPKESTTSHNLVGSVAQVSFDDFRNYMSEEMRAVRKDIINEVAASISAVRVSSEKNTNDILTRNKEVSNIGEDIREIREAADPSRIRKEISVMLREERNGSAGPADDDLC